MMAAQLPICCAPQAFKALAAQADTMECPDSLLAGAVAVSMHAMRDVSVAHVDARIQKYTDAVRARVRGRQPQALLAHLHDVLFEIEHFAGNNDDYYDIANNFVPRVLETKRGLPIALSLIYREIGARLGLRVRGLNLPGHFLVGVEIDGGLMLVDPFASGREVSAGEAHERMKQIFGQEVEWSDDLLQPATARLWLTRMLQNLLNAYGAKEQYYDVAAMLEMEMLLWPNEARLQRDLGLVLARCGLSEPARWWLDRYLQGNPDDPQHRDLRQLLEVLNT